MESSELEKVAAGLEKIVKLTKVIAEQDHVAAKLGKVDLGKIAPKRGKARTERGKVDPE